MDIEATMRPVTPYANDLEYLQDELAWIELRAARIRAKQTLVRLSGGRSPARRAYPGDPPAPTQASLRKTAAASSIEEEERRQVIDARLRFGQAQGFETGLDRLCRLHDLSLLDRMILLVAVAPILERRFEDLVGSLGRHGEGSNVTVEAALAFADLELPERLDAYLRFAPTAPLIAHDLIVARNVRANTPRDLVDVDVDLPGRTFALLVGRMGLREDFAAFSTVETPRARMEQVVLPEVDKARILSIVDHRDALVEARRKWGLDDVITYGRGSILLFHGQPGTGKTLTAHAVAHHMGLRILTVDLPTLGRHAKGGEFLPGLFREARLQNALLFFDECEVLFESRATGNALMTILLTEIEKFEGVAILATNMPERLDAALDRRMLVRLAFPPPDREARREIWRKHLPASMPLAKDVDLDVLAERFDLAGGYIKNAVLTATAAVVRTGGKRPKVTMAHLVAAAQAQSVRIGDDSDGARPVVPKTCLADVMLPAGLHALVEELIDAARNRRTVLEKWGIGTHLSHGKGVTALLHGAPGTGKTLCAEAIAFELSRPLLTAAAPGLLSKWVGESEQNIARIFARARQLGAVLFLDEADSLIPQRDGQPGGNPRHEVSMINTPLTEIERHDGVVLLATNLPGTLDGALERRLTYQLDFPFPSAGLRARIWRRLLPATVPTDGTLDFDALGRDHSLSGGLIKNAVFKAAFRAVRAGRHLSQADLNQAATEEGQGPLRRRQTALGFAGEKDRVRLAEAPSEPPTSKPS